MKQYLLNLQQAAPFKSTTTSFGGIRLEIYFCWVYKRRLHFNLSCFFFQVSLDGNEMYAKLNALEDQLAQLETRKTVLEEDIASITMKADYEPLKKQAMDELALLNKRIIEDLNNIKSY